MIYIHITIYFDITKYTNICDFFSLPMHRKINRLLWNSLLVPYIEEFYEAGSLGSWIFFTSDDTFHTSHVLDFMPYLRFGKNCYVSKE